MKFIIFTNDYSGLPLGLRLQEEGHTVLMALIEPQMAEEKYQLPKDKEAKEKKKIKEICEILGKKEGTVKFLLHRGIEKLRSLLIGE